MATRCALLVEHGAVDKLHAHALTPRFGKDLSERALRALFQHDLFNGLVRFQQFQNGISALCLHD